MEFKERPKFKRVVNQCCAFWLPISSHILAREGAWPRAAKATRRRAQENRAGRLATRRPKARPKETDRVKPRPITALALTKRPNTRTHFHVSIGMEFEKIACITPKVGHE